MSTFGTTTIAATSILVGSGVVLSQLPEPESYSGWGSSMVVVAVISSIAINIIQPWIKERGTSDKLKESLDKIKELQEKVSDSNSRLNVIEEDRRKASESLADLADSNRELIERLGSMIRWQMARDGKAKEGDIEKREYAIIGRAHDKEKKKGKVLLVEDDPRAREPVVQLLELSSFDVFSCGRLDEAIVIFDREKPSHVILDLMLPDGDGSRLIRHARLCGWNPKIIVATGKSISALDEVRSLSPSAILVKPYDFFVDVMPLLEEKQP